jgi:predicted enzyme related to lactoylglutathione lyase
MKHKSSRAVTNYIAVLSIDECVSKIDQSGGKVAVAKTEIQNMGFLQCFQVRENNLFGLYEGQRK